MVKPSWLLNPNSETLQDPVAASNMQSKIVDFPREKDSEQVEPKAAQQNSTFVTETTESVALRTIPVYLKNGNKKLRVNLLDDTSTKTYLNADVAAELGLQGQLQKININVLRKWSGRNF